MRSPPEGIRRRLPLQKIGQKIGQMEGLLSRYAQLAENYTRGIKERFPARNLIPFAKRADCDDVACFEFGKPGKIEIIHDFCDPGWEQRGEYDSFWDWFMEAIEEMIHETDIEESSDLDEPEQ